MQITAAQIASLIHATVEGDPQASISDIAKIEEGRKDALSFIANAKYEHYLYTTEAGIVLVSDDLVLERPVSATLLRVPDPYASFATLLEIYQKMVTGNDEKKGIEEPAYIHATAVLGQNVYVGAFSYIGKNAKIGDGVKIYPGVYIGDQVTIENDAIIYPGVKIYHNCIVGKRSILHSGVIVGSDGFGFAPLEDGTYKKIPQLGNVIIEDDVEIGSNSTVDRATMGSTIIRKGVKLDNLIQVAHNVEIGEGTVIASQTGISGSTKIGKHCMIGGQAGIVGHIQIADRTRINAQSGVSKSINKAGTVLTGSPAGEFRSSLKSQAIFRNLPGLLQRIQQLEDKLAALSDKEG
jgi:UDP-3-O-[3-hydroxymyristoyl] glucosamine N-acyltransferase